MDSETLNQIKRMCEIVLNNTFGNPELDSLALSVGHHPDVLNAPPFDPEDVLRHMSEGASPIRSSDWSVDKAMSTSLCVECGEVAEPVHDPEKDADGNPLCKKCADSLRL